MNRRTFILHAGITGGLLETRSYSADSSVEDPRQSLKILLLGGTGYIGTHFAQAAIARRHHVAVFSRGQKLTKLPSGVEQLVGDRDHDLKAVQNREWDAVFDLATYGPSWVRSLGRALEGRVRHYTFISTILAYQYPGATDENSVLQEYTGDQDPYGITELSGHYGALKVLCEEEAHRQFPGKVVVLRPGTIVGPGERVGSLTYWAARMERGGEVLAAGLPVAPVQFIDVRDLAEWAIRLAEVGKTGIFTAVGPAGPLGWAEMLGGIRAAFAAPTTLTWVPAQWLAKRKLGPFNPLMFWPEQSGFPGSSELSNNKARAAGLTFRPLHTTIMDTLNWYHVLPAEKQGGVLLQFDEQSKTLDEAMAREAELLNAWHATEA